MELSSFRYLVVFGIFALISGILIARLFAMQVIDPSYQAMSKNNSIREIPVYPSRGLIADRNNNLIVNNEAVYDIIIIPKQVKSLDTNKLCKLLDIQYWEFVREAAKIKTTGNYAYQPQVLFKQVPSEVYARFQEYLYQFPGLSPQVRTVRSYQYPNAAHILGYIGEVNQKQIDTSNYYKLGDYIGISGIEFSHENELRGNRGTRYAIVDVLSREIGGWKNGAMDKKAIAGKNLQVTLDIELQKYAEQLMENKKGSVVAIEPSTGEVLALVSSPTYNPNLLSGINRGEGIKMLLADTLKPMFNRALMANYPPGSTFKPLMGLIAMQENVIDQNYYYGCYGGYSIGRLFVGCHSHPACHNMQSAILNSCNSYFCQSFKLFVESKNFATVADGLNKWHDYLTQFNLGRKTNIDLPNEQPAFVPNAKLYDKMYKNGKWRASTIISLGIGQGELGTTSLQLSNLMAIIANRGFYYYPHVVRPIKNDTSNIYNKIQKIKVAPWHFNTIIDGMERVVLEGTATIAHVPGLEICGKTGTAENPHGKPHSLFVAFAPKNNPKIAIAAIVENAGWGASYGAPIASLLIEKYIKGFISEERKKLEEKMFKADLIHKRTIEINNADDATSPATTIDNIIIGMPTKINGVTIDPQNEGISVNP